MSDMCLHSHICELQCGGARDTDGTQMETDNQASQRNTALSFSLLTLPLPLFFSVLTLSLPQMRVFCEALTFYLCRCSNFLQLALCLSQWIYVPSCACSLLLWASYPLSLSLSALAPPIFSHTLFPLLFSWTPALHWRHPPSPTHTHLLPPPPPTWILANGPLLTGSIQPALTVNGPCN